MIIILSILLNFASAETQTFKIKGMDCRGCVKIIDSAVCRDKEMSTWFASCQSKVVNANTRMGELMIQTLPVVSLDEKKLKKIKDAVEKTGRSIEK